MPDSMQSRPEPKALLDDLEEQVAARRRWSRSDFFIGQTLVFLGIVASVVCFGLMSSELIPGRWFALLSCIPAAIFAAAKIYRFEERSDYNWEYYFQLRNLVRQLQVHKLPEAEVAKNFDALEARMINAWPKLGSVSFFQNMFSRDRPESIRDPDSPTAHNGAPVQEKAKEQPSGEPQPA